VNWQEQTICFASAVNPKRSSVHNISLAVLSAGKEKKKEKKKQISVK
jgi:hypothetical protein